MHATADSQTHTQLLKRLGRALCLLAIACTGSALAQSYEQSHKGQLSPELRQWSDNNIAKLRTVHSTLQLQDSAGTALANAQVTIRQTKKAFCFGSALNEWVIDGNPDFKAQDPAKFKQWFEQHFNCGTPASTLHWKLMESERDKDGVGVWYADKTIQWMRERDMQVLGHAVSWENPELVPDWVKQAPDSEALKTLLSNRIKRLVGRYQGDINHWVGVNEMLDYDSISAQFNTDDFKFRPWLYQEIKAQYPSLKLLVNEAGILAEPGKVEQYKALIKGLLADGAPIDIIGIQAHFWPQDQEFINFENVKQRLDSLAELGLPIWITEFDYAHPDETIRANQLEGFYRLSYAHPAVQAVKSWGFWEGAHWRADWGTPVALVDRDWRVAASGARLGELMEQWSTTLGQQSDVKGQLSLQGYAGDYIAEVQSSDGKHYSLPFKLQAGADGVIILQP